MIRFSQRLQDVLASTGWTQVELARRAGVSATNVSRWLGSKALPDRQALGKVIEIIPDDEAARLVGAWVYDALPENADRLVAISPRNVKSVVEDSPDEWPKGLNLTSRRKFIDFSRLAMDYEDVMKIVDVLHAASARMARRSSKTR